MKVLSKVLWAIDLNSDHNVSLEKIQNLIEQFGTEVILLHVLPSHIKGGQSQKKISKSIEFELQSRFVDKLRLSEEHSVRIRVETGDVANEINKVAKAENVNLVLLNKGKTATLGPNGFNVLRRIQTPVAVLSDNLPGEEKHIVCPVDNSDASAVALKSALLHARKINAKLTVLSIYKPFTLTSPRLKRAGLSEEKEKENHWNIFKNELEEFLKDFDFSGVKAEALLLEGNADEEIIKFSENASILYVGSGGKGPLQRAIMGSVSEKVIREASCNVVVVKNQDVFKLRIPAGLESVELHFKRGNELRQMGFLKESISQFKSVLKIDEIHFASIEALAEVYDELEDEKQALYYKEMAEVIRTKMNNRKIEEEIRRNFRTIRRK